MWTPRGRGETAYDPRAGGSGQPARPAGGADYTAQCPQAAPSRAHHGQAGSGPVRTGPPCPPPRRVLKDALRIGGTKTTSFANLCGSGFLAPGEPTPSHHLGSAPFYFPSAISSPWAATPPPWAFPHILWSRSHCSTAFITYLKIFLVRNILDIQNNRKHNV